ncbi:MULTISPECIES: tetratricopeptide repeat protein [unclassified Flammeovirga]|uniref:tetratricopeptide repeat protein n=1 Tax=unclassified Flammeovirga TaxID=2637820 RepID=UPI0005C6EBD2|nr:MULTISPECIES: tetratricopeptide repeat protein [unclassified Flammeovirga]MBD0403566.1 tetratricopeptide repeat protein [Flammeovirga sp. EKP202]
MKQYTDEVDSLFKELKKATESEKISDLESSIIEIWQRTEDPFLDDVIILGVEQLTRENYKDAIATFSHALMFNKSFAEVYNKRAVAYYMRGEYNKAVADLKRALELEPRHFGALSGLCNIYREIKLEVHTLKTLETLLRIIPNKEGLSAQAYTLRQKLRK